MSNAQQQSDESGNAGQGHNQGNIPPFVPPPTPPSHSPPECKKGFCEKYHHEINFLGLLGLIFYCWVNWREWRTFDSERVTMQQEFQASQLSNSNQLVALQGQLNAMRSQTVTMQGQWQAMTNQAAIMQGQSDEMRLDERAWIEVSEEHFNITTNLREFVVQFKNTGKTPAHHLYGGMGGTPSTNMIPPFDDQSVTHHNETVPPDGTVEEELNLDEMFKHFSPQSLLNIQNGGLVYAYGTVFYDDVFGKHHWTQFCFTLNERFIFYAPIHNETDDTVTNAPY